MQNNNLFNDLVVRQKKNMADSQNHLTKIRVEDFAPQPTNDQQEADKKLLANLYMPQSQELQEIEK